MMHHMAVVIVTIVLGTLLPQLLQSCLPQQSTANATAGDAIGYPMTKLVPKMQWHFATHKSLGR